MSAPNLPHSTGEASDRGLVWLLKTNARTAAAGLAVIGLITLFAALGAERLHGQRDPLFGLSNRTMLVLLGLAHLGLTVVLLIVRDLMNQGLLALWMGVNYLVYIVAMAWANAVVPCPAVRLAAWKLGVAPSSANVCWKLFVAYLLMGSLLHLALEWRRLKRLESEALLEQFRKRSLGHS